MSNLNTKNQSKDKITSVNGYWISTVTCFNENSEDSVVIQLTGLESMWYNHEENINHPEGEDYPTGVNHAHRIEMVNRVADSILHRTGINIKDYENVIHASTSPGRNPDGSFIEYGFEDKIIRNVA
tara:strand:- start:1603 stop:1980 length:378 start_codon:yes stop_codon:yes gene_type:complete